LRVTSVSLRTELVEREGSRLVAVGSVELDGQLRIEYIRVVRLSDGRFLVAMPSQVNNAGEHQDVVHPTTKWLRKMITDAVLDALSKKDH